MRFIPVRPLSSPSTPGTKRNDARKQGETGSALRMHTKMSPWVTLTQSGTLAPRAFQHAPAARCVERQQRARSTRLDDLMHFLHEELVSKVSAHFFQASRGNILTIELVHRMREALQVVHQPRCTFQDRDVRPNTTPYEWNTCKFRALTNHFVLGSRKEDITGGISFSSSSQWSPARCAPLCLPC